MKAAVLALGLYRSSGGPSKSIRAFASALDASVISWVDPRQAAREPQVWDHCQLVRGSTLPLLGQLCYPRRSDVRAAEDLVVASDLVSCHSFWRWHNIWLVETARRHGRPYWFVPHGALDPYVFESDRVVKRAFLAMGGRRFLDNARAVVCATEREYQKLAPFMPAATPAILPWPLDERDFRVRNEASRARLRGRLRIPDDAVTFLFFGRLHPMKRPLETISTFAEGAPRTSHLVILGNECGITCEECTRRAHACGISDRVHVVGAAYGEERDAYLDACDVYVSLSHRENFNFTAAESLAGGLPVMLSPGNDLGPELASAGCAWVLESLDDAAQAMAEAGELPVEKLAAMGARGRAWADANLRFATFRERIRDLARTICEN